MKESSSLRNNRVRCLPNQIAKWHHLTTGHLPGEQAEEVLRAMLYLRGQNRADLHLQDANPAGDALFFYLQTPLCAPVKEVSSS